MTNAPPRDADVSTFVLRHSFVIRSSSFDITRLHLSNRFEMRVYSEAVQTGSIPGEPDVGRHQPSASGRLAPGAHRRRRAADAAVAPGAVRHAAGGLRRHGRRA